MSVYFYCRGFQPFSIKAHCLRNILSLVRTLSVELFGRNGDLKYDIQSYFAFTLIIIYDMNHIISNGRVQDIYM